MFLRAFYIFGGSEGKPVIHRFHEHGEVLCHAGDGVGEAKFAASDADRFVAEDAMVEHVGAGSYVHYLLPLYRFSEIRHEPLRRGFHMEIADRWVGKRRYADCEWMCNETREVIWMVKIVAIQHEERFISWECAYCLEERVSGAAWFVLYDVEKVFIRVRIAELFSHRFREVPGHNDHVGDGWW